MDSVLVTGACGFIGSNFVHHLLRHAPGLQVVALDNLSPSSSKANLEAVLDRVPLEVEDICDPVAMEQVYRRHRPAFVVNFAAESHNDRAILDPSSFARTNALGAQILLEMSRRYPVRRHVQVSTIEVYGELPPGTPHFNESSPLQAKTPYSAAKAAGDLFARAYLQTYPGMDIVITHCANNYGPYQLPEKLIPLTLTRLLSGLPAPLYGDGLQLRDWLHVEDHCRALLALLRAPRSEVPAEAAFNPGALPIFDIGARNELTNLEVVTRIVRLLGRRPDEWIRFVADRPNHDRRYLIDPAKIESWLGWRPAVDFEQGLEETVRWYIEHEAWWRDILRRHGSLQIDWSVRPPG